MRFSIVTPVLNGEKFLDQTILSVVSQAGPFSIRYHIQDGGSKDATLGIVAAWQLRLARDFPLFNEGVEFSFASVPDRGLYDAINQGFAACGDSDAMAWINADDRFEPGAFATVEDIFKKYPDIDWVTGRPTTIAESRRSCLFRERRLKPAFSTVVSQKLSSSKKPHSGGSNYGTVRAAPTRISGLPGISISGGALRNKAIS